MAALRPLERATAIPCRTRLALNADRSTGSVIIKLKDLSLEGREGYAFFFWGTRRSGVGDTFDHRLHFRECMVTAATWVLRVREYHIRGGRYALRCTKSSTTTLDTRIHRRRPTPGTFWKSVMRIRTIPPASPPFIATPAMGRKAAATVSTTGNTPGPNPTDFPTTAPTIIPTPTPTICFWRTLATTRHAAISPSTTVHPDAARGPRR